MTSRDEILKAINACLDIAKLPEHNGLQVEGRAEIKKIVFGVSAHMALFEAAHKAGADMIIVHHGLFWPGIVQPLKGVFGRRCAFLLKHGINLAGYHLPLDCHPALGNNAMLAQKIRLKNIEPFGDYHGASIGFRGVLKPARKLEDIHAKLGGVLVSAGKAKINTAAVISGGACDMLRQAEGAGIDLYITGTRDEFVVEYCKEAGISFIAMGHYNSEKSGIQALMAWTAKRFNVQTEFIDIPNPF
ncbi:MAG: Nif3-like dinuclear metal center hexameric protein [Elusimicrobiota bacterium]|jgi:dinuclear metal center YbgI/SA1388 family protein|nr:Nif3-like dinuclear metal center hexameric protein [Elusimicrobiota bacterium]